jgi:hypothetical protein
MPVTLADVQAISVEKRMLKEIIRIAAIEQ